MNAIQQLKTSGMTTSDIAEAIKCTPHAVRYYERGMRFPSEEAYKRIVELAASRGLTLAADAFIAAA